MYLILQGHDYRYAAEQMLLTLFPEERPEYLQGLLPPGENAAVLTLRSGWGRWPPGRSSPGGAGILRGRTPPPSPVRTALWSGTGCASGS